MARCVADVEALIGTGQDRAAPNHCGGSQCRCEAQRTMIQDESSSVPLPLRPILIQPKSIPRHPLPSHPIPSGGHWPCAGSRSADEIGWGRRQERSQRSCHEGG
ncbi:uncharacterized protein TrAtP1_011458 [Trichoderma atroviride]|uniref:Uncharacterized protein n=1 Tax=Hypocrea atroviridis (strain ATCC 20476 / IMI 206040) TaxID=452589 RepID=G9P8N3_HYPAI|nr:uncharacterized protein TRIATDRAFT_312350 [Trichoderma atroviride IMI 206040]EHK41809.1 hypothetical protein TRIATDRAFT_312350 [Trichoderma atroviride IMI 206040]UKZ70478.1 hypothetical protein TrAtP1_011458 [Trichoderma atroviride]